MSGPSTDARAFLATHGDVEIHALLAQVADDASAHLESIYGATRSVAPAASAMEELRRLSASLPEDGRAAAEVAAELARIGGAAAHASVGPRYFGFVTGGALPAALAADWLSSAWDQNAWAAPTSPCATHFEALALAWLLQLLRLPGDAGSAALCSGCTAANVVALAAARDAVLAAASWDAAADGLLGAPPITVYTGEECHGSVLKALGVVGLGRGGRGRHVRRLAVDAQGAVSAAAVAGLAPPAAPAIVVLQAGHVNTGASDDFGAVIAWARSGADGGRGVWVHVDGAFGLWAAASASADRRALVAGAQAADSWATDLHKMLNVPYDSALVAVRNGRCLHEAMSSTMPYLPPPASASDGGGGGGGGGTAGSGGAPALRQPAPELQNSRRARGVVAWAALQQLGRRGVSALVDGCCAHAALLAQRLQEGGAELLHAVRFNQALVAFGNDACTAATAAAIQRDGRCWAAAAPYHGRVVLRLSVSSWRTSEVDIEEAARAILECAAAVSAAQQAVMAADS
jgi:glutamate/tyrosine decarboxylase-like PLP-dependent enzyme